MLNFDRMKRSDVKVRREIHDAMIEEVDPENLTLSDFLEIHEQDELKRLCSEIKTGSGSPARDLLDDIKNLSDRTE